MRYKKQHSTNKLFVLLLAMLLSLSPVSAAFAEGGDGTMHTMESAEDSGERDATSDLSEEELARRKEIYTMVALITMGAIIVGIREKRGRR